MTLGELFIIYFSFGAPLAVYSLQRTRLPVTAAIFRVAASLLFWPVDFLTTFVQLARSNNKPDKCEASQRSLDWELASLIADGVRSYSRAGIKAEQAAFRETAERYVGLMRLETDSQARLPWTVELTVLATHPRPDIATACLARAAGKKVASHRARARSNLIRCSSCAKDSVPQVADYCIKLAELVGDHSTMNAIRTNLLGRDVYAPQTIAGVERKIRPARAA